MKTKKLNPGDRVSLKTRDKTWKGHILESYDSEIILLKLDSGYNIGIREREIIDAKIIEKSKLQEKKESKITRKEGLKNIALIMTGGTISSRLDPKTGGVIPTDAEEILNLAPEIKDIANITKIEKPFMKFSENMDSSDWKKIAETAEPLLNDDSIDGIIITHGTDTLHYTASALAFFIQELNKPIALTYSQRSIDRGSTDASLNLTCAAKYATSEIAEIAIVGHENENDDICLVMPATRTRKMHTSARGTFKIINAKPIAEITKEKLKIKKEFNAKDKKRKIKLDTKFENKVALIKIHPGIDPKILDYYEENQYKGLVIEATGLGHVPEKGSNNNWLSKIRRLIEKGTKITAVPQTLYGRLNPNVYTSGRNLQKTGIIFLRDMLPETALVKLGWVLGHKNWKNKIKEKLLKNIAGEIAES